MFGEAIQITTGSHPRWLPASPANSIAETTANSITVQLQLRHNSVSSVEMRLIVELANENVWFLIAQAAAQNKS